MSSTERKPKEEDSTPSNDEAIALKSMNQVAEFSSCFVLLFLPFICFCVNIIMAHPNHNLNDLYQRLSLEEEEGEGLDPSGIAMNSTTNQLQCLTVADGDGEGPSSGFRVSKATPIVTDNCSNQDLQSVGGRRNSRDSTAAGENSNSSAGILVNQEDKSRENEEENGAVLTIFDSKHLFKDTANGYLSDDACVLGAEVQVVGYVDTKKHSLSIKKVTLNNAFTWKIGHFSSIKVERLHSQTFEVGERQWKLLVDPKGSGDCKGKSLSIFLQLADYATLPPHTRVYAEYKLATKSQTTGKNSETKCTAWFCDSKGYGRRNFMWLNDLNDKSKGYIVSDSLIIEVVFIIIGIAKNCG
ncbi:hypothetical protein LguiA_008702 [Lonicera macranthoides]